MHQMEMEELGCEVKASRLDGRSWLKSMRWSIFPVLSMIPGSDTQAH